MGYDHNRAACFQFHEQVLYLGRGNRIKRRAGFVQQQYLGIDRQRPRDTQALLLPARKRKADSCSLSLTSSQREALFRLCSTAGSRYFSPLSLNSEPVGDVLEDRFGKWVGFLEHHPHPLPQVRHVHAEDIFVLQRYFAFGTRMADQFVHPVQSPNERRFPTAGRSYQSGYLVGSDVEMDVVKSFGLSVIKVEAADASS